MWGRANRYQRGGGKIGRANASESSLRLRDVEPPETLAAQDGGNGLWGIGRKPPISNHEGRNHVPHVDTDMAPEYRGCPPRLHLASVKRGNPHEVWYDDGGYSQSRQPVGLSARQAQLLRRTRWSKKRRPAAERHREFITCRIGPQRRGDPRPERAQTWTR
jgi:hypothetical protein